MKGNGVPSVVARLYLLQGGRSLLPGHSIQLKLLQYPCQKLVKLILK